MAYIFYYRYLQMTIIKKKRNLGGGRSRGVRFTSFSGPLMRILQRVSFTSLTDPARRGKNQSWRTATARRRKCSAEADHLQKASEKKNVFLFHHYVIIKNFPFYPPENLKIFTYAVLAIIRIPTIKTLHYITLHYISVLWIQIQ